MEDLEKKLGKEIYENLKNFLVENPLGTEELSTIKPEERIERLYKLKPEERIKIVYDFCNKYNYDFAKIYADIETVKEEEMKSYALRSAVAAILTRDGPAAISNPKLYEEIRKKVEEIKD